MNFPEEDTHAFWSEGLNVDNEAEKRVCVSGWAGAGRETRSFQTPEAGESLFYEYLLTDKVDYWFVTFIMLYIPQLNLKCLTVSQMG